MKILSLKYSRNNEDVIITFDNNLVFYASIDIVLKYSLYKNLEVSEELYNTIIANQRQFDIKQIAYHYSVYKPRTCKQVKEKLKQKGLSFDEINYCISFLFDFNLLDDEKYARNFVHDYLKTNNVGKPKLVMVLVSKGIKKDLAISVVEEFYPVDNTIKYAKLLIAKKIKLIKHKPVEKQKILLTNHLIRNGFEFHIIFKLVNEYFIDIDEK